MNNLDTKGIKLSEISAKYPRAFQPLGYDTLLDVDEFMKPKVISTYQLCINSILELLFMKPGQFPSIPDLGIDIEQYLHEYSDDSRIPEKIIFELKEQCNRLHITGLTFDCSFDKTSDIVGPLIAGITF